MASAFYSEDLTCSICLTLFTDPVNLLCGHSFCRQCITDVLSVKQQCPHCRTDVSADVKCLPTSHILRSLAEKAREAEKIKAEVADLCPEHEEKLKLFCVTDQQLVCIICRDGERHEGHKFKPVKEAAASLKQELGTFVQHVSSDTSVIEGKANTQKEEITKTKDKAQQLMIQLHRQFEEMHQFLTKREDEILNELKHKEEDAVKKMVESHNAMEASLSENRELESNVRSVLEIEDPEVFLKSWTKGNSMTTAKQQFRPRGNNLQVVNTSLSLGPYESHLQFFVWKEMLEVIQPRAELLSLKLHSGNITVSKDGRSLFSASQNMQTYQQPSSYYDEFDSRLLAHRVTQANRRQANSVQHSSVYSVNEFTSGQHYWEIEVGNRNYWELGLQGNFLKYNGKSYVCGRNASAVSYEGRPRKIGIYLNFSSQEISFYDADNMKHIHTMNTSVQHTKVSAYIQIDDKPGHTPLTVCWY